MSDARYRYTLTRRWCWGWTSTRADEGCAGCGKTAEVRGTYAEMALERRTP